jgi:hypothetical protein
VRARSQPHLRVFDAQWHMLQDFLRSFGCESWHKNLKSQIISEALTNKENVSGDI